MTELTHKTSSGGTIASFRYGLDKVGNRLSKTTLDTAISYQYDPVYRLTQALSSTPGFSSNSTGKGGGIANATEQQKEFYTYDPVGNRLTSDRNAAYAYNEGNELISAGGTYSYDKNGNLIQKVGTDGTTAYSWDYENRLVKVMRPDGTATEFSYDPFGRRISKKITQGTAVATIMRYFYDDKNLILEYDGTGLVINKYVHGPGIDEPVAVTTGKETYFYHIDGLGSVVALTDQRGNIVQTYGYDSFGNLKDQKNRIKQAFSYTGREWDKEIGLYYYRARYYDPMAGRFISQDPIGLRGGINFYAYVYNSPISLVDPQGLAGSGAAIGGTIGAGIGYAVGGAFGGAGGAVVCSPSGPGAAVCGGVGAAEGAAVGATVGAAIGAGIGSFVEDVCRKDKNEACYRRWEAEDARCDRWWPLGAEVVYACKERAADRRTLCYRNGGKPNPAEPPEYDPKKDW